MTICSTGALVFDLSGLIWYLSANATVKTKEDEVLNVLRASD